MALEEPTLGEVYRKLCRMDDRLLSMDKKVDEHAIQLGILMDNKVDGRKSGMRYGLGAGFAGAFVGGILDYFFVTRQGS